MSLCSVQNIDFNQKILKLESSSLETFTKDWLNISYKQDFPATGILIASDSIRFGKFGGHFSGPKHISQGLGRTHAKRLDRAGLETLKRLLEFHEERML